MESFLVLIFKSINRLNCIVNLRSLFAAGLAEVEDDAAELLLKSSMSWLWERRRNERETPWLTLEPWFIYHTPARASVSPPPPLPSIHQLTPFTLAKLMMLTPSYSFPSSSCRACLLLILIIRSLTVVGLHQWRTRYEIERSTTCLFAVLFLFVLFHSSPIPFHWKYDIIHC